LYPALDTAGLSSLRDMLHSGWSVQLWQGIHRGHQQVTKWL